MSGRGLRRILFAVVLSAAFLRPVAVWQFLTGPAHLIDLTILGILILGLGCGIALATIAVWLALRALARMIVGAAG